MLDDKDNPRGRQAFDVSVAFTVLAFISVALRLYTRWFIVRAPGIEDHLIIVATVRIQLVGHHQTLTESVPGILRCSDCLHRIP